MYRHLNRADRTALATLLRARHSQADAAREIGFDPSAVSRELKRNKLNDGTYHAASAAVRARNRRKASKEKYRLLETHSHLAGTVEALLHPLVSPEVIAHELGIHHQSIYAWVYRTRLDLKDRLPQRGKKRRRYGSKREAKQGWTKDVHGIDARPEDAEVWEGDTIRGAGTVHALTHVHESLYTLADLVSAGADAVHEKTKGHAAQFRDTALTYDRGSEFALWRMIERDAGATVFFAHAHHPWERGKNENTNGRLRRVFPKRFDFGTITQRDLDAVTELMNHTPRKSLSWRTPCAVYGRCRTSG